MSFSRIYYDEIYTKTIYNPGGAVTVNSPLQVVDNIIFPPNGYIDAVNGMGFEMKAPGSNTIIILNQSLSSNDSPTFANLTLGSISSNEDTSLQMLGRNSSYYLLQSGSTFTIGSGSQIGLQLRDNATSIFMPELALSSTYTGIVTVDSSGQLGYTVQPNIVGGSGIAVSYSPYTYTVSIDGSKPITIDAIDYTISGTSYGTSAVYQTPPSGSSPIVYTLTTNPNSVYTLHLTATSTSSPSGVNYASITRDYVVVDNGSSQSISLQSSSNILEGSYSAVTVTLISVYPTLKLQISNSPNSTWIVRADTVNT